MDTNLEIRQDPDSGMFGIFETGGDSDSPLVMFAHRGNAELVMSEMLVQPATLLNAKLLNRFATAIYDLISVVEQK